VASTQEYLNDLWPVNRKEFWNGFPA